MMGRLTHMEPLGIAALMLAQNSHDGAPSSTSSTQCCGR